MANVLVVDDNADTCRVLAAFLTRAGHHAICTASVSEAMEKLDEQTPDLVITDLMMPYQSGYDLLRLVRRNARTRELPVIIFSAIGEAGYIEQAVEMGATDYWLKGSISVAELSDRLRAYLPAGGWAEPPHAHPMVAWKSVS
jgi:two-component system phosphate regulon response regulator PhoB